MPLCTNEGTLRDLKRISRRMIWIQQIQTNGVKLHLVSPLFKYELEDVEICLRPKRNGQGFCVERILMEPGTRLHIKAGRNTTDSEWEPLPGELVFFLDDTCGYSLQDGFIEPDRCTREQRMGLMNGANRIVTFHSQPKDLSWLHKRKGRPVTADEEEAIVPSLKRMLAADDIDNDMADRAWGAIVAQPQIVAMNLNYDIRQLQRQMQRETHASYHKFELSRVNTVLQTVREELAPIALEIFQDSNKQLESLLACMRLLNVNMIRDNSMDQDADPARLELNLEEELESFFRSNAKYIKDLKKTCQNVINMLTVFNDKIDNERRIIERALEPVRTMGLQAVLSRFDPTMVDEYESDGLEGSSDDSEADEPGVEEDAAVYPQEDDDV